MAGRLISLPVLAMAALSGPAMSQLADPTRPPPVAAKPATTAGDAVEPVASGLQSILLRKNGKPAALIHGELVELGGKVGDAKLVRISENSVLLRGPQGEERLWLTPAAEKKPHIDTTASGATQDEAKSRKKGNGK